MDRHQPLIVTLKCDPSKPEAIEFFRFIGMCVCAWAFVERHLYQIFHHATGFQQNQSALLYYRIKAFNNRLRLVDDALKQFLAPEQFQAEWKPLRKQVDDLSNVRNIFVHHPPLRRPSIKDGKPTDIYSIHIEPYERVLNNEYKGLRGKSELEIADLQQHEKEVGEASERLHTFARRMGDLMAAFKTSSASVSLSEKEIPPSPK